MARISFLVLSAMAACVLLAPALRAGAQETEELTLELSGLRDQIRVLEERVQRTGGDEAPALTTALKKDVFSWATEDGKFAFTMNTRIQVRLTYNDERGSGEHNSRNGRDFVNFRIRRAKTTFKGHIFEKEFQYEMAAAWTSTDSNKMIEKAYFRWARFDFLNIAIGQDKTPFNWEEMTSSGKQMFIDRGIANETFNEDYAKGLWLSGKLKGDEAVWVKYQIGIYNGVLKKKTDFRNADQAIQGDSFSSSVVDNNMMVSARVETHPLGEVAAEMWDRRGEDEYGKILFTVGIGFNWFISRMPATAFRPDQGSGPAQNLRNGQDTISLTADANFRWHGLSVYLAYFYKKTEFHNFGSNKYDVSGQTFPGDVTDQGFALEVGYFILPKTLNVGVRWNMVDGDDFWAQGIGGGASPNGRGYGLNPDSMEYGLVVNYLLHGNNLKVGLDFTYVSSQLPYNTGEGILGHIPSSLPGRGETGTGGYDPMEADYQVAWQLRLQLQWIF